MDKLLGWNELFNYAIYIRGISITLFAILLFRASSSRLYGNHSPLDFIIFIIIGAVLGEAIANNMPLLPSMVVSTSIIIVHRFFSYLSFKSHFIGQYIKGDSITLIENGNYIEKNLYCSYLTANDILQALRVQKSLNSIVLVKKATLERSGQISFIMND